MLEKDLVVLAYPKMNADAKGVSLQPPLSLLYIAAAVRSKYEVVIFDQRVQPISDYLDLLAQNPLCVGLSSFTGKQVQYAVELAAYAKDAGIITVMGGIHATLHPEQTQMDDRIDHVIVGDGENVFPDLLKRISDKQELAPIYFSADYPDIDLDSIGFLPYNLVDVEQYIHVSALPGRSLPYLFSRGCPYKCTFCCNPALNKSLGWRAMSVEAAMKQIDKLVDTYRLDGIFFHDENLSVNIKLLEELAGLINNRFKWAIQARADGLLRCNLPHLEKMGLYHLGIGVESGSPRILEMIKKQETVEDFLGVNKKLAHTKIETWYNFMTGFPGETVEDIRMTINLALKLLDDNPMAINNTFYTLVPYPGTEIGELYHDRMPGCLAGWADFDRHNYNAPWHSPEMRKLLERITFSSKFVGRKFFKFKNEGLDVFVEELTQKWRDFDFMDDKYWDYAFEKGWEVLKELFGDNAY